MASASARLEQGAAGGSPHLAGYRETGDDARHTKEAAPVDDVNAGVMELLPNKPEEQMAVGLEILRSAFELRVKQLEKENKEVRLGAKEASLLEKSLSDKVDSLLNQVEMLKQAEIDMKEEKVGLRQQCKKLTDNRDKTQKNVDALKKFKSTCFSFMNAKDDGGRPVTPLPEDMRYLISETPSPEETLQAAMNKFKEIDEDASGELDADELPALAEWVWNSFNIGLRITDEIRDKQAIKIMRKCDSTGSNTITMEEFVHYYETTQAAMKNFSDSKQYDAMNKFAELDADNSGALEGKEIMVLASWVWCSFNPQKRITPKMQVAQREKILAQCDHNGDSAIDKEEFLIYYDEITALMEEFNTAMDTFDKLDEDGSGELEGDEILLLAGWVWKSFRAEGAHEITDEERAAEAQKILKKVDTSGDGSIDKEEFLIYYTETKRDLQALQRDIDMGASSPTD